MIGLVIRTVQLGSIKNTTFTNKFITPINGEGGQSIENTLIDMEGRIDIYSSDESIQASEFVVGILYS